MDMPFCCPLPTHFSSPCLRLVRNPGERTRVKAALETSKMSSFLESMDISTQDTGTWKWCEVGIEVDCIFEYHEI
jgi:hypothetical protein